MRKLSAVAFITITITIDHGTVASNCLYSSGCRCLHAGCDAALRKRYSRCESRGLLPCPQQTAAQFRLRSCVELPTGRGCNPRTPRQYTEH